MTDPFADDGWDELTRELGVEKSPPPQSREPEPSPHDAEDASADDFGEFPGIEVDSQADEGEFDGDLGDEAEGDAPDGAEPASGDEQPDPGRKRRRRRRRRKKGPDAEGEGTEAAPGEEPGEPVPPIAPRAARAPVPVREEPEFAEAEYDPDEEESSGIPLAAEEDTAGEVLRELIATWNVPSWDAIITGLNRPER